MMAIPQSKSPPEISEAANPLDRRAAVQLADALRKHLLLHQQMGIDIYPQSKELQRFIGPRRRKPSQARVAPLPAQAAAAPSFSPPGHSPGQAVPERTERQADLTRDLAACSGCNLVATRITQVLGQGKKGAGLLIVGDYPAVGLEEHWLFGQAEDELLWKMMQAIKLGPRDVYVTNVVKCSPADKAIPTAENEQACQGYLHREIALVQPRIILALGVSATRAVLGTDASVFRLRGRLHPTRFLGVSGAPIPVMVSFHPRFLLEQPAMKKASWQDLQIVQRQLLAAGKR